MLPEFSPQLVIKPGPYDVRIERGEWVDAARGGRVVPYKIYRPAELRGKHALIIWSHGLGGTRDGAGFIARQMASLGYIYVNVQHRGTDDVLWRGMDGHPWDNIRKATIEWDTVRDRYLDVPFALDNLEALYPGHIDWARVGMSGHSFGALTTQVVTGQLAGREVPEDLHDPRPKAGLLYSPVPAMRMQLGGQDVYRPINRPLLHMTGTRDSSPVEGFGYQKRFEVFEGAGNEAQHMLVLDGADHMVFAGSRGQLEPYEGMALHQDIILALSQVWWQAWLFDDARAHDWLEADGVQEFIQNKGRYFGGQQILPRD